MGLSERKTKQRLASDPRNLTWAHDNSRFGQQYLEKFGWTAGSGSGLGAAGQGRLAHISVAQKLNLLGIGGNSSSGDVSWQQNRDYELMLKRLNTSGGGEDAPGSVSMVPDGFVRAVEDQVQDDQDEEGVSVEEIGREERKRLRKEQKRKEKAAAQANAGISSGGVPSEVAPPPAPVDAGLPASSLQPAAASKPPRRMAHRAKFRASKQLAASNAAALSEILGIAQSAIPSRVASQAQSALATPADSPTPAPTPAAGAGADADAHDQIRASTTSVGDYFAAKMKARLQATATATATVPSPPTGAQPAETISVPAVPSLGRHGDARGEPVESKLVGRVDEKKKEKKRKRKDVVENAGAGDDRTEPRGESDKKKKKRRKAE